MHYRPYASTHGGRAFYAGSAAGSGDDSTHRLRKRSLRQSGSAVLLSDLELEGSYHGCACCNTSVCRHDVMSFDSRFRRLQQGRVV